MPVSSLSAPGTPDAPLLPDIPALAVGPGKAVLTSADGETEVLTLAAARDRYGQQPLLVCHRAFTLRRLSQTENTPAPHPGTFDILDLFVFVRPARTVLPTPRELARALGLPQPSDPEEEALLLFEAAGHLLTELRSLTGQDRDETLALAHYLHRAGWSWGTAVVDALDSRPTEPDATGQDATKRALRIWTRLNEWEDRPPPPPSSHHPVSQEDAQNRLQALTGARAEYRKEQLAYTASVTHAFAPRETPGMPSLIVAEAGTGIGKTLGYLAPASLWAEKNRGQVWISTYTKNLQRQIEQEMTRLYPDQRERDRKSTVRKGRENYLCLLNLEDMTNRAGSGSQAIAVALAARWARYSRDGDMVGGDFPSWLPSALGQPHLVRDLADRHGECTYSACPHYKKCFVEKALRRARHAQIVIANHAVLLTQAAQDTAPFPAPPTHHHPGEDRQKDPADRRGKAEEMDDGDDMGHAPPRVIFDEAHHLFNAADAAFSCRVSGLEMAELRRWIRGSETRRPGRSRGLAGRISDLLDGEENGDKALHTLVHQAALLPGPGWLLRLREKTPHGPAEKFLNALQTQVRARTGDTEEQGYSIECDLHPLDTAITQAARELETILVETGNHMKTLAETLQRTLENQAGELGGHGRIRADAALRGLEKRLRMQLSVWQNMLAHLTRSDAEHAAYTGNPSREDAPLFVDWLSIERDRRGVSDMGLHRHWLDPTLPMARAVLAPSPGILMTSATLRDVLVEGNTETDTKTAETDSWENAAIRTGVVHLPQPGRRAFFSTPFDYAAQSRIFVVVDVNRNDTGQIAAAYHRLFVAAGGGALGLFTSVARLGSVYQRLVNTLGSGGLPLYAQHIDAMDTGTLVDIFRAEEEACLLGTDAVRDGIDVPGNALRMIVFDRTPWPRPDILHRARRDAFGKGRYDDMITRLKLKQAYGRLIRRLDDRGVFVLLDSRLPTRLTTAFPQAVEIRRVTLDEAVTGVHDFLSG